jgi:hypothetical protein
LQGELLRRSKEVGDKSGGAYLSFPPLLTPDFRDIRSEKGRQLMRLAICLAALLAGSVPADARPARTNPRIGAWQLLEYIDVPEGGEPLNGFGTKPIGMFVFTPDGHVSISLMTNPRVAQSATPYPDPDACVPDWYCSYFGTYTYDPKGPSWTTHVIGGNIPSYLGTDQRRQFKIEGDVLTISETYVSGGKTYHGKRVLRRLSR